MARPAAIELTQRELEVMHVFWKRGQFTAWEARDQLAAQGIDRAYVTVANLVRILVDEDFWSKPMRSGRFTIAPCGSFRDVSRSLVHDLVQRIFPRLARRAAGSDPGTKKADAERTERVEQILKEQES